MKTTLRILLGSLMLCSQLTLADDNLCARNFGQDVKDCAINLSFLQPNQRAGAQKACVDDAKLEKDACMNGVNTCLADCQTTYDTNVASCNSTWDPSLNCADTDVDCIALYTEQRSLCISSEVSVLNQCTAACNQ